MLLYCRMVYLCHCLHFILITLLSMITDSVASIVHLLSPLLVDQACARQALLCACRLHTLLAWSRQLCCQPVCTFCIRTEGMHWEWPSLTASCGLKADFKS